MSLYRTIVVKKRFGLSCPILIEKGIFKKSYIFGSHIIISIDYHTFSHPLHKPPALSVVHDCFLQVEGGEESYICQAQSEKSLSRHEQGSIVKFVILHQSLDALLLELEH